MKKKILITGSHGIIGTILTDALRDEYDLILLQRPEADATKYQDVVKLAKNCDTIIHLAWNSQEDKESDKKIEYNNATMFLHVYAAALENAVSRVIMASSVHADRFQTWKEMRLLSPQSIPHPISLYGVHKLFMESMGSYYASQGLDVTCVRFGGVTKHNKPVAKSMDPLHTAERNVWLSHNDCISLIKTIIQTPAKKEMFTVMYAVSNNQNRIHDIANPYGWTPKDCAED